MSRDQKVFTKAYKQLNLAQKEAVDSIEGPVMVVAGPGTGKTTLLTLRIAKILKETDTTPESILALTFTNAGVKAMREKLHKYIHDDAYRVGIYTFHSFAEQVLTRYNSYFPQFEGAKVIDSLEKVQMVEQILSQGGFKHIVSLHDPFSSLSQVVKAIDEIKKEGLNPEEFKARIPDWQEEMMNSDEMFYKRKFKEFNAGDLKPTEVKKVETKVAKAYEIAEVFSEYQKELEKRRRYDFSDMIISLLQALETNEDLKSDLQEQYQYLLVDEHQDTNNGQNRLIELLSDAEHLDGRPNIFTVGDEKQSIYRFQGASAETFSHLHSVYKDVKLIELEENYRSTASILNSAFGLITNTVPELLTLRANKEASVPVKIAKFSDYKFELLYVMDDIKRLLSENVDPDEIAIIYRSNKHLEEIKTLLQLSNIPFKVLSKDKLLDDPQIRHFIELLRVIDDPYTDKYLGNVLFAKFLDLSALLNTRVLREYDQARREGRASALVEFLCNYDEYQDLLSNIEELKSVSKNKDFREFIKIALHTSGFLSHVLTSPDSATGLRRIDTLFSEIKRQSEDKKNYQIADFLAFVDAEAKYNLDIDVTPAGQAKGVACMTAHGSKGLEFSSVYMVNTTMNNWEKSRGFNQISLPIEGYRGDIDDERRLFFVAMTRAKNELTITASAMDWHGKPLEPSQFISEIPDSDKEEIEVQSYEADNLPRLDEFLSVSSPENSIFDPDYLAELFREERLSVTSLNNYIDCSIKYLFRNLIHLPDIYTDPQRYGEAIHSALESFFKGIKPGQSVGTQSELLDAFDKAVKDQGFSEASYQRYLDQGHRSLMAYYQHYQSSWLTDVSTEEYVRTTYQLPDGSELTLSGKLDKLEFIDGREGGKVRVVDYKTGKTYKEKTKDQKAALDRQIIFYHLLLGSYKDDKYKITEAVLDFVEPREDGTFEQKTFQVTKDEVKSLEKEIQNMYEAVISGAFLNQGCQKKDCEYCSFYASLQSKSPS